MEKVTGFTLIELMVVVAIIGILALIAIPNFVNMRNKAYDASAKTSGKSVALAEHIYYNMGPGSIGRFTDDMKLLMEIDRNLFDDPGVTFSFLYTSNSGFTFYSQHSQGSGRQFIYTD